MYGAKYVGFPERNLRHMILHDTMDLCIHLLSFQIAEMKTKLWLNFMEAIIFSSIIANVYQYNNIFTSSKASSTSTGM